MRTQEHIERIVVHCADTPASMDIGVDEIDRWHRDRGWSGCGYHYVIRRDGEIEHGRPESIMGAHVRGYNRNSLGICLVGGKGGFNYTRAQMKALEELVGRLRQKYTQATVEGHCDLDTGKTCPNFNVSEYFS
jgi:N-acetylmuramoyl-L-alanine amidase